jgi:hypothetical protein
MNLYDAELIFRFFQRAPFPDAGLSLLQRITGKGEAVRLTLDIESW